ncbi:MAG: hypothetical protein VX015_04590 [Planctomycetota bacterium]|nr:hypothetical protein [Planctomycetota bacterium]
MKRLLLTLLVGAIAAPAAIAAQELAVDRELALRALAAERGLEGVTTAAAEGALLSIGGPDWAREFAALDAVYRAGGLHGDGFSPARREVGGPALRILVEPDPGRLTERLLAALDAPHLAWREAALDRLARALLDDPAFRGVFARRVLELERPPIAASALVELLTRIGLHGGTAAALERLRTLGGSTLDASWEEWMPAVLPLPFDREAIGAVGSYGLPSALMQLVGAARAEPRIAVAAPAWARLAPELDEDQVELVRIAAEELQARRASRALGSAEAIDEVARALLTSPASGAGLRMLDPLEGLAAVLSAEEPERVDALEAVDGTASPLPPAGLLACVERGDEDLAMTALYIAGRRFAYGDERELLGVVLRALASGDDDLVPRAFDWISTHAPEADGALLDSWRAAADVGERRQLDLLRRLTRERRSPLFRDDLLELLLASRAPDPSVIELCGLFEDDAEVQAALRGVLSRALDALVTAPSYPEALAHDGVASQLARALGRSPDGATVELLADGLRRTMDLLHGDEARGDARPKFPKRAVLELARVSSDKMADLLDAGVPRRVRVEAGLQILAHGAEPELATAAGEALLRDFSGVDGTLRLRILRALSLVPAGRLVPGLDGLIAAQLRTGATPEARAAIELAAARGRWRPLDSILRMAIDRPAADEEVFELAREVAVRRADDGAEALEVGAQLLVRCDGRIAAAPAPDLREALVALRGGLLQSCARGLAADLRRTGAGQESERRMGPAGRAVLVAVLARPLAAARGDLAARLEGRELLRVDFRWAAEVEAFTTLAAVGLGPAVLEATPGWSGIDGRVLVSLGRGARGAAVAPTLIEVGLFGLGGERPGRGWERARAAGWLALAGELPEAERWRAARGLCLDLWTGRVRQQVVGALEGETAEAGPVLVRVAAAALQGRPGFAAERAIWLRALPTRP